MQQNNSENKMGGFLKRSLTLTSRKLINGGSTERTQIDNKQEEPKINLKNIF